MTTERTLDKNFWNQRYLEGSTGWDLGKVSEPIAAYIDQLTDRNIRILIPGCGNAYEAEYLAGRGFTDITLIDIAPELANKIAKKFEGNPAIKVLEGDFFDLSGQYDLILEQTFFCALDPKLRTKYVEKMHQLLASGGKVAGVLFDKIFENQGPPFGGSVTEYRKLFETCFHIQQLDACYNSATPRAGSEVFIILQKI
jgi:SAM-dependent methyltransferase